MLVNPELHRWELLNGTIGLSYCSDESAEVVLCDAFTRLLANSSDAANPMFGLDLNEASKASEMHLGGVGEVFSSSMVWATQTTQNPSMHSFMMRDLRLGCGDGNAPNIFGPYGNTWPAVVDTGSVCLSLPGEMFDNLHSWWGEDASSSPPGGHSGRLPDLSFSLADAGTDAVLLIRMSDLIVNRSDISAEVASGGGLRLSGSDDKVVCVLRGSEIVDDEEIRRTPHISLGSLALRSLYFAADFSGTLGFANKNVSNDPLSSELPSPYCKSVQQCAGDQDYDAFSNSCNDPDCLKYFFVSLNTAAHRCEYKLENYALGIALVVIFLVFDVMSILILTKIEIENYPSASRPYYSFDSWFITGLGRLIMTRVDYFISEILRWTRRPPLRQQ